MMRPTGEVRNMTRLLLMGWIGGGSLAVAGSKECIPHVELDRAPLPKNPWAFEAGVSLITNDNVGDILLGQVHVVDNNPAAGVIYTLTAT